MYVVKNTGTMVIGFPESMKQSFKVNARGQHKQEAGDEFDEEQKEDGKDNFEALM